VPDVPWVRALFPPSDPRKSEGGQDVVAHKRAMSRAGHWPWRPFDDDYSELFSEAVKRFQKNVGIQATGLWGRPTQNALANEKAPEHPHEFAYDKVAIMLLNQEKKAREKPNEQRKAEVLLVYCNQFDGPYVWGGEHDGSVIGDSPHAGYDCSSSCSSALAKVGLLGSNVAHVSGWFKTWGNPGYGKYVTVHAASDHVWMEFTIPGKSWARFDTSPHGDGSTGPRVRHKQRSTARFIHRHPPGL
jgi:hypothetical protein